MNTIELSQEWRKIINSFSRSREPKLQKIAFMVENFCSVRRLKMGCNTVFVGEPEKNLDNSGNIVEFKRNLKFSENENEKKFYVYILDPNNKKATVVPQSLIINKFRSGNEQGIYIENINGLKTAYQFTIRKNKVFQFKPITLVKTTEKNL